LTRWAEEKRVLFAVAGLDVLDVVRGKLEERRDSGAIDARFYRENLAGFSYLADCGVEGPEAILVVSVPRPAHVVAFERGGGAFESIIPPTYYRYREFFEDILAELKQALGGGTAIGILKAPLKSLSVHMGLTVCGRNNVTYAPGLGSYHQLCGYVVGGEMGRRLRAAFGRARPEPAEASLELCRTCRACVKACPTAAIRGDRFLISAEKCYTLIAESRGALPDGIGTAGPKCLVGCLACQVVCPENKDKLTYERLDVVFTDAETEALLALGRREAAGKGVESGRTPAGVSPSLWVAVKDKFGRLRISVDVEAAARNLST
jgi:epoxyqueuosine reductase